MLKFQDKSQRNLLVIAVIDFLLVFVVLLLSRRFLSGEFPRWFFLVITSVVWVLIGILTHKLDFWHFADRKRALLSIPTLDLVVYLCLFGIWKLVFPEREIQMAQLLPLPVIIVIEILLYLIWNQLFRKVPYLYVDVIEQPYRDERVEKVAQSFNQNLQNQDFTTIVEATKAMNHEEACQWIKSHRDSLSTHTLILENDNPQLLADSQDRPELVICLKSFNNIRHFNQFLAKANEVMANEGTIVIYGETSSMRRHRILHQYPVGIGNVVAAVDYMWSRALSKLALTRSLYTLITRDRNRNYPRVEVLGRMAKAGFDISGEEIRNDVYHVSAVRRREPVTSKPNYGLFLRLPRKGKNGKMIGVFKLRTMYAYAEYVQDYAYKINGLEKGGKLKDDFRVNLIGSFCRSRFLDEIPMFINLFIGDLKLVGVRPLSKHYLSLYTPEMQQMHLSVKPGIFPPLYYDYPKPNTLEEIQDSERRYIERYRQHPHRTDWLYFWGMVRNIVFHRERSH